MPTKTSLWSQCQRWGGARQGHFWSVSLGTGTGVYLLSAQESHQRAPLLLSTAASHHWGPLVGEEADEARRLSRALQQPARPEDADVRTHGPVDAVLVLQAQTVAVRRLQRGAGRRSEYLVHTRTCAKIFTSLDWCDGRISRNSLHHCLA